MPEDCTLRGAIRNSRPSQPYEMKLQGLESAGGAAIELERLFFSMFVALRDCSGINVEPRGSVSWKEGIVVVWGV